MKTNQFFFLGVLTAASIAWACAVGGKPAGKSAVKFKDNPRAPAAMIPAFVSKNPNPSLEAQLGNLLLGQKQNAIISIPVRMKRSDFFPFGDKQSNAKMGLGEWKENGFPAVGIQTVINGKAERKYIFHPSLKIAGFNESKIDGSWFKVQPTGWKESFYFNFSTGTLPISELLSGIPEKIRTFSGHRVAPDMAKVGKGHGIERFENRDLGPGYNKTAWPDENVHGRFPKKDGEITAIGGVKTWGIVDKQWGPFKNLYTCFQDRKVEAENQFGAPSGAGWHHIGNSAETLLNNLVSLPIPIALARSHSFADASYKLGESITATWLQSDEAFVTVQNEFHWYLNPYETPVCTEIWVQNCIPNLSNNWGFNCPWIE